MTLEGGASIPELPPTVAEWEDLLVRVEIMPRALRATLDGGDEEVVSGTLGQLLAREQAVGEWLEIAAGTAEGTPHPPRPVHGDARTLAERFTAVRARNFAMVQRRGVDVWEWVGETPGGDRLSVYQLLTALVQSDGEALAGIRGALQRRPSRHEVSAC